MRVWPEFRKHFPSDRFFHFGLSLSFRRMENICMMTATLLDYEDPVPIFDVESEEILQNLSQEVYNPHLEITSFAKGPIDDK